MSWRIDVEIGRRTVTSTTQPTYMVRLDLSSSSSDRELESINMQASYTSLKVLQRELQQALGELQGVHAQRLTRYIV